MNDRVFRALGVTGALAAGLLAASCGMDRTEASLAESRAAVGSPISFNLIGANTAMAPTGALFAGDTIRTTGSGSFNSSARTIAASGSFTHIKADGSVFARGTWSATAFTSFLGFGGPNPGTQGGQLKFSGTLFPAGGSPVTFPFSVTCLVNKPSGFTEDEGTTVGPFTEKTGGTTLFHQDN